jgi:hypothetical protein
MSLHQNNKQPKTVVALTLDQNIISQMPNTTDYEEPPNDNPASAHHSIQTNK